MVTAEEDLRGAADYHLQAAARMAALESAVAFPIVSAGEVVGVIELVSEARRTSARPLTMAHQLSLNVTNKLSKPDL